MLCNNRRSSNLQTLGLANSKLARLKGAGHLRLDEVEAKSGFKRAHIYNLMRKRQFPQALRLGVRAVGWDSIEIDEWIAERLNNRA